MNLIYHKITEMSTEIFKKTDKNKKKNELTDNLKRVILDSSKRRANFIKQENSPMA